MTERIPQIGEVIGRYRILEVIGRGATGPVYRAWDETLAREVALKMLWPQFQSDARVRSRFEREARAIAKLESPHIVRVYDVGESDGAPFIAMEYIRGGEVRSPVDPRRAAEIVRDVAAALERAHENGIIHRDIKPANVMIGVDGRAKLADFGLARAIADEATLMTNTGTLLGTPAFLAPEIIEGHEATPLSDIYSLGILLYRLVAGRSPFDASSPAAVLRAHLKGEIPALKVGPLDEIIAGCTALKTENRYPTATFLREDLEAFLAGRPIAGPPPDQARIDFAVPFWARFIPGAQKTLIDLSDAVRIAETQSTSMRRDFDEALAIARDLESRKAESARHASGWRSVAERLLTEEKENEAREALESALAFDAQADGYAQELERQMEFLRRMERDLRICEAETESARTQATLLRSRRHRAAFGMIARRRPAAALAASLAVLVAGVAIFALAAPKKITPPVVHRSERGPSPPSTASGKVPYTVVLTADLPWEGKGVMVPDIWTENGRLKMIYRSDKDIARIGLARSTDGLIWTKKMEPVIATAPPDDRHVVSARRVTNEIFLGMSDPSNTIHRWRRTGDDIFTYDGQAWPMKAFNGDQNMIAPGSIIKTDKFYMYGHATRENYMNHRNHIFRLESDDGQNWKNYQIILSPTSEGDEAGGVSFSDLFYDPGSGEWVMWYMGASNSSLYRARSRDGITFHTREKFLVSSDLSDTITSINTVSEALLPSGRYLYLDLSYADGARNIVRLDIPDPHKVPAFATNRIFEVALESAGTVWMDDGVFNIFYATPDNLFLHHATSVDGLRWSSPRALTALTNPYRTIPQIIPGTDRGLSSVKKNNVWTIRTIEGLPHAFRDVGEVGYTPPGSPGTYDAGSVVKTDNGFVLYGNVSAHGFRNGLYNIYRAESADGRTWSEPEIIVTGNDRGLSSGHVMNPFVTLDATRREWTMWYGATDGVSGDERIYICRAKSSDGKTFHSHEIFLTPEEIGRPEIQRVHYPSYVSTKDGNYLYFAATGAVGGATSRLMRMKIPA